MSSHHVVREAQEPALLILDPAHLSGPGLAPILEWSPTIIAIADAIAPLTGNGLKIDVVIAEQHQLTELSSLLETQAPVHIVIIQPGESLLTAAFGYLTAKKHQAVNVLSSPDQLQQGLSEQLAQQEQGLSIVLLDGEVRYALYRTGQFSKWLPAGEKLHLSPALASGHVSTSGFSHNPQQATLQDACHLETAQTGRVYIQASCPIWVGESLF